MPGMAICIRLPVSITRPPQMMTMRPGEWTPCWRTSFKRRQAVITMMATKRTQGMRMCQFIWS